jgi:prevent-host-death family protein
MKMNAQKFIPAAEFKQKCLALIDEVATLGLELVITKHGSPVCKLTPLPRSLNQPRFGWLKGSIKIHVDLTEPVGEEWEANN